MNMLLVCFLSEARVHNSYDMTRKYFVTSSFHVLSLICNRHVVDYTDMRRLMTGIRSEKCVVRRLRLCANVIQCTYTNLDSTV